ncbi:uncharacterized protein LOC111412699 [Olea europaea var. sylvestris]|uniref:uncharacterized protein LOC111412699 n=1 Tax=Olea europaea var. sylvestris TaxID=158386 RepID=UPI000C1D52E7|nr:uncharacterized protein LOC111412699 [Olea europaea var. sylvestris]
MEDFSDFIRENMLVDLPMIGGEFTWFLICEEWEAKYSDVTQRRLGIVYSDHFPIMLSGNSRGSGRRPLRFEKMWLKVEGFGKRVPAWWASYEVGESPSFVLDQKLKALKEDLKRWNEEIVGNVNCRKIQCLSNIEELDRRKENQGLAGEEKVRHRVLREKLERLVEIVWYQKSRVTWLKEEDKYTKFFHKVANSNKRNNSITVLDVDGVTYEEPQETGSQLVNF